ncbi:unnamed protein product, partial [Nippostrongylus brasiliensis]|uniref:Toll-like receptor 9 n=1 Tax=Nippostrongylus brasiliensis TaxID=27835 RepID=A0A0N4XPJ2_NIPBR
MAAAGLSSALLKMPYATCLAGAQSLTKLHQFIFNKISHLHHIDLSDNELSSVSPYVFSDCAHLTSLNLSHNLISQLFHDSLTKCPLLKRVDLSDNRLTTLADALPQASAVRRLD